VAEAQAQPDAPATTLDGLIAELQQIRVALRRANLADRERATLRLRGDIISGLIAAVEKRARLPRPKTTGRVLSQD